MQSDSLAALRQDEPCSVQRQDESTMTYNIEKDVSNTNILMHLRLHLLLPVDTRETKSALEISVVVAGLRQPDLHTCPRARSGKIL